MSPSTWKCRTCSTVNWSTTRGTERSPRTGILQSRLRGCHRCVAGQIGRYDQAPFAAAVQRVNAGGCSFVSSVPLADDQGRAVLTGSFACESFQDAIRHREGRGVVGQEGKSTVRCQTGARQGVVSPGRIEVRPTETHSRDRRVGGKFRLAGGLLHGRRRWWLAGSSSWRCSSNVSWHRHTEDECTSGAHNRDQATLGLSEQVAALTGMLAQLQQEVVNIASSKQSHEAPASPVHPNRSAAPTPSIPQMTRSRVFALDDLPSIDGGRRTSRSPRGAATKPVSFCMAEATPPVTRRCLGAIPSVQLAIFAYFWE